MRPDSSLFEAPRVETSRLILRPLRDSDFAEYWAMTADPETYRFAERGPMASDEAWTRLLRQAGHWAWLGYGLFAIEEKSSGRFVGETGLADFRRGLDPAFDGCPEASWTIAAAARGRGYALEAAQAAHGWFDAERGGQRTVCLVHADNRASLAIAAALGYRAFAERLYRGYPTVLHERSIP